MKATQQNLKDKVLEGLLRYICKETDTVFTVHTLSDYLDNETGNIVRDHYILSVRDKKKPSYFQVRIFWEDGTHSEWVIINKCMGGKAIG